jgi:hypothetical protein
MRHINLVLILLCLTKFAFAQGAVFVCLDKNGTKTYQNTGEAKGCRLVVEAKNASGGGGSSSGVGLGEPKGASAKDRSSLIVPQNVNGFDGARKKILTQELKIALTKMDELKAKREKQGGKLSDAESTELKQLESDVKSLRREIESTP